MMSLQEKIRKVLHKAPYQHDQNDMWVQIEAQLPKKDNNRLFPFFFLLVVGLLAGLWYNHSTDMSPEITASPIVVNHQDPKIAERSELIKKDINIGNNGLTTKADKLPLQEKASHQVSTASFSKQNSILNSRTYEKTPNSLNISNNQLNKQSTSPLAVTLTPTVPFSQTDVAPQHPSTDFVATAQTSYEKVKESNTTSRFATADAEDVVFAESRSPHVVKNSKIPLSHLQLFDVPKHGFNLLLKIPIKEHELFMKSPWTVSVATFVFKPTRSLSGQNEYVDYKNRTETSDPSFMVSIMAGRSIYKGIKGHIGLQYDAIYEYHQGKSTTTRTEKILSDSASYYLINAKPVFIAGELSKTITEGKQYKVPNTLQRWSIPVALSYQFAVAKRWLIEPNVGLCYTFSQRFDGITINEEGTYLVRDVAAFTKMYKQSNLFSLQTGLSGRYSLTDKVTIDARYQYGSDLKNTLQSANNSMMYRRHAYGVGLSYWIK